MLKEENLIEEDKLLRFHERLKEFIQKHLNLLLNIVIFFVILIVLSFGWFYYQKHKEKKALEEFVKALHSQDNLKALQELAKKYPSTQAGRQANLILWETLVHQGQPQRLSINLETLKKIYPKKLEPFILYGKAKLYEDTKKESAQKIYLDLLKEKTVLRELVLFDLARLSLSYSKTEAKKYLEELKKENPNFYGIGIIESQLRGGS